MTSPVGHTLGGLISASWSKSPAPTRTPAAYQASDWRLWLFVIFAANAPDLDFVPGILIGSVGAYHHLGSHSLFAVLLFALLIYLLGRWLSVGDLRRWVIVGGSAYFSHLVLDMLTADEAPPFGMQLLWPFSKEFYIAPFSLFTDVHHGGVGETLQGTWHLVFSLHNLGAVGLELAILLPLLWLSRLRRQLAV